MLHMINGHFQNAYKIVPDVQLIGAMATPYKAHTSTGILHAIERGAAWCLDNGCYIRYEPAAIVSMLKRWQGLQGCKFVVVPDVVRNHDETMLLFRAWVGTYEQYNYPCAFVLQNGVTPDNVPYGSIAAVFIGGDDRFKYSDTVRRIVARAKQRGLWVHMGRVNTQQRIKYAASIGCDSVDGTSVVRFMTTNLPKLIPFHEYKQLELIA